MSLYCRVLNPRAFDPDRVDVRDQVRDRVVAALVGRIGERRVLRLAGDRDFRPVHCRSGRIRHRPQDASVYRLSYRGRYPQNAQQTQRCHSDPYRPFHELPPRTFSNRTQIAPEMQTRYLTEMECSRNTKQLTGLSFTRFDTVTGTKSSCCNQISRSVTSLLYGCDTQFRARSGAMLPTSRETYQKP